MAVQTGMIYAVTSYQDLWVTSTTKKVAPNAKQKGKEIQGKLGFSDSHSVVMLKIEKLRWIKS